MHFLEQGNQHEKLRDAVSRARTALGPHAMVRLYEGILADIDGEQDTAKVIIGGYRHRTVGRLDKIWRKDAAGPPYPYLRQAERHHGGVSICTESQRPVTGNKRRQGNRQKQNSCNQWKTGGTISLRRISAGGRTLIVVPAIQISNRCRGKPDMTAETTPSSSSASPRSGTTLLDTLLRGHPAIKVAEGNRCRARDGQPGIGRCG